MRDYTVAHEFTNIGKCTWRMSAIRENGSCQRDIRIEPTFSAGEAEARGVVLHSAALNGKQVSSNSLPTKLFYQTNLSYLFFFHSFMQHGIARAWETRMQTRGTQIHFVFEVYRLANPLFQKIGPAIRQFRLSCLQRPLKRPVVMSPPCIVAFSLEAM